MNKIKNIIGSKYFILAVFLLFILQSIWIAISSKNGGASMIFDEPYHLSVIKNVSENFFLFFQKQNPKLDSLGPIARTPSVLYYSIFGGIFWVIEKLINQSMIQIILLRFLHIIAFTTGIYYARKTLRLAGLSKVQSNISTLLFIMLPVFPFLAAQINYDNLMFLLGSMNIFYTVKILKTKSLLFNDYLLFIITGLATILTQVEFVPIFLFNLILIVVVFEKPFLKSLKKLIQKIHWHWTTYTLIAITIILGALSVETYLINIVEYGGLTPNCVKALSVQRCSLNGIYERQVQAIATTAGQKRADPTVYLYNWRTAMTSGLYYVAYRSNITADQVASPGRIFKLYVWASVIFGAAFIIYSLREILTNKLLKYLLAISIFYTAVLFLYNYRDYLNLGVAYGLQGRYILPVLPFIIGLVVYSVSIAIKSDKFKLAALAVILIVCMQGGGINSYIRYSNTDWYWHNNVVYKMNSYAKDVVKAVPIL